MSSKAVAGGICAPKGFSRRRASIAASDAKRHNEKYDLALIQADVRCAAAGVYTTNKVCGAPIKVDRAHLTDGYAQAIVVNSGNANTCAANGVAQGGACGWLAGGAATACGRRCSARLHRRHRVEPEHGPIEQGDAGPPPAGRHRAGQPDAAAHAILTTDLKVKEIAVTVGAGGQNRTDGGPSPRAPA